MNYEQVQMDEEMLRKREEEEQLLQEQQNIGEEIGAQLNNSY